MLRTIHKTLIRLQTALAKRPVLCISIFSILYLTSAAFIPQLKILTNIDDLIDSDFKTYSSLQSLNQNFINSNNTAVFVEKQNSPFTKGDFCQISKWLRDIKLNFDGLSYLITSSDIKKLNIDQETFSFNSYLNPNCHIKIDYEKEISSSLQEIQETTPWKNIISSKNSNDFVIEFYFDKASDERFGKLDVLKVKEIKESLESQFKENPNLSLYWAGDGIFQYYLRKGYDKIALINLLVMIILIFGFRYFFGTYKSGFIYIVSISIATTVILGGMALFSHPMDVLSNCISLMLFVSSVEDFVFLTYLRRKHKSWKLPFKKLLLPSFLTSLTTFIGFGSLYFSDIEIIQRFGLWAAIGSIIEWAVLFLFLPALLIKFPKLQNWVKTKNPNASQSKNSLIQKINNISFPKSFSLLLLFLIPLSLFGASKIKVSDSPQNIFSDSHPGKKVISYLNESRGWKGQVSLIFKDKNNKDFNKSVLNKYSKQGFIAAIEDPYLISEHITKGTESNGLKDLIIKGWKQTVLGKKYYNSDTDEVRALLFVKELEITYIENIIKYNKTVCPNGECYLAGSLISYSEFGSLVLGSLFKSFLLSLLLVTLVLLGLTFYFKTKHKLSIIVSALWGPLALMSLFYILGVSITYITSLIAAIMVGLAGDNAIQFIFRKKDMYKDVVYYQNCAFFITICMIGISFSFFLSDFAPVRKLGFFMIAGFIFNYIGDVFILKSLIKKSK